MGVVDSLLVGIAPIAIAELKKAILATRKAHTPAEQIRIAKASAAAAALEASSIEVARRIIQQDRKLKR
jgi:hypothetical protein